jgi:hypothetical protein
MLTIIGNLLGCLFSLKNKKAADPLGSRGQFRNLFALSKFSLYLVLRAIRPWPLPDQGKRYVKANQE